MKKGDIVRFVTSGGGGVVSGFQKGGVVLVEDEDGFEIPALMSDVVVVEEANDKLLRGGSSADNAADTNSQKANTKGRSSFSVSTMMEQNAPKMEYSAGNKLTAFLAFIPVDPDRLGMTSYEEFFVNDSNYSMYVTIAVAVGQQWKLRHHLLAEPNSKVRLTALSMTDIAKMERIAVQLSAFKTDREYELKPSIDVQLRMEQVKFCKAGSFRENDFFEEPAMFMTLIEADKSARPYVVETEAMKREMYSNELPTFKSENALAANGKGLNINGIGIGTSTHSTDANVKQDPNAPIVVDLHADALLDTLQGMSSADILDYQMEQYHRHMREHLKEKGRKIVFIHGKGEGRLRSMIIQQLGYRYKPCTYQDASFREYGYGATQVTIK